MRTYAERARAIQPTGVRKMFDLAGEDTISFGLGEPDFQPPPVAIEAFHQAMLDGRPLEEFAFDWFVDNDAGFVQASLVVDFRGRERFSVPPGLLSSLAL